MKKFFKQKNNITGGFTLIETLVAISIFTMSIVSVMVVISGGISDTNYAKKKIIAGYLAQEGIEEMRNMRDTSVLYFGATGQVGWDKFVTNIASCLTVNGCYFDNSELLYSNDNMPIMHVSLPPCNQVCPVIMFDETNGKYEYNPAGVDSGFNRKITAVHYTPDEIKITSVVSWVQGSGVVSVTFSENLFNWTQ